MLQSYDINQRPWLIDLDTIDSTNNYAMRLVQDGMAHSGMVVYTQHQFAGKGQRGKQWNTQAGEAIAMSLIYCPAVDCDVYSLSFAIPVAVRSVLQKLMPECQVDIKWPNDIYVNNSKLAGILIENTFRGSAIKYAVIGIGVNMRQTSFVQMDRTPISVLMASGRYFEHLDVVEALRNAILAIFQKDIKETMQVYQSYLWRKGSYSSFKDLVSEEVFEGEILGVNSLFELEINVNGTNRTYQFGKIQFL